MNIVKRSLKKLLTFNENEPNREKWLKMVLASLPRGLRILDAGAGELRNKQLCDHLNYVSQDFAGYTGTGNSAGLQTGNWDTSRVDIVSDICSIPEPDASFDCILCSEVFEHLPNPIDAIREFSRLLKPEGKLILTAPFVSLVHFAPFHFCVGFSRYWYEHHLPAHGFKINELTPNGDWFSLFEQEAARFGTTARSYKDPRWPFAYLIGFLVKLYFKLGRPPKADDLACFGWHCIATRHPSLQNNQS